MSVDLPVAGPVRRFEPAREVVLADAPAVRSAQELLARDRSRRPGAHREAGSNPWRTGLRELVMALTWGKVVVFRPAHRLRLAR